MIWGFTCWLAKKKKKKNHNFPQVKIKKKKSIFVDDEHQLIPKQANVHNINKTPPLLLLDAWLALNRLYSTISRFLSSSPVVESRHASYIHTTFNSWNEL